MHVGGVASLWRGPYKGTAQVGGKGTMRGGRGGSRKGGGRVCGKRAYKGGKNLTLWRGAVQCAGGGGSNWGHVVQLMKRSVGASVQCQGKKRGGEDRSGMLAQVSGEGEGEGEPCAG